MIDEKLGTLESLKKLLAEIEAREAAAPPGSVVIIGHMADGVRLWFDKPIVLNGGLSTQEWFVNWNRLGELLAHNAARPVSAANTDLPRLRRALERLVTTVEDVAKFGHGYDCGFDAGKCYCRLPKNATEALAEALAALEGEA